MKTATTNSQVGIFWVYKGRLMPVPVPLTDAERRGRKLDSPLAHVKEWPRVVGQHKGEFPVLSVLEYDQIPRGRVILDTETGTFIVYVDRALFVRSAALAQPAVALRAAILEAFALRRERVVFRTDPHYDTPPWDRIDSDEDQEVES